MSDATPYSHTRNKHRSAPAYLNDHSNRAFSSMRSERTSPAHSRHSSRRSLTAKLSQPESETDSGHSRSKSKKIKKIEKRQLLSSIPKMLRYNGKGNWKAFYTKLSGYDKIAEWTYEHKREQSEQSAKQGTSHSSRSPTQDRSNNYSPRRNYGRGSGRRNNSGDRRYTIPGYYNNESFNCHKQGHYVKECPDLYVQDTGGRQSVQKEPTSQQVSFSENKDEFYESEGIVSGVSTIRSLGAAKLIRVEVDIAGRKVLALVLKNMPLIIGDDNTAHEPFVNKVHGSDSSSDEKPSTEGSTKRSTTTQLTRQSD
ncbi:Hypothetical predicted protein [Mytilus galloprovincialis]|uniref:CCHC-type domain-containing protein n=1 Tax=Mytilus galloprovincialis TaxID=29158 RepID=A0A8B6H876_MYTGA|nr:Hypothetical predicted protein [Mytilus galloprovincialis]